jgi:hypothetical protein
LQIELNIIKSNNNITTIIHSCIMFIFWFKFDTCTFTGVEYCPLSLSPIPIPTCHWIFNFHFQEAVAAISYQHCDWALNFHQRRVPRLFAKWLQRQSWWHVVNVKLIMSYIQVYNHAHTYRYIDAKVAATATPAVFHLDGLVKNLLLDCNCCANNHDDDTYRPQKVATEQMEPFRIPATIQTKKIINSLLGVL